MPKKTDTGTLAIDAYRKIKMLMLQRKISAGQKLLYRELISWLDMSKTPIINALNRLEQDGFIVSEANRGFYVKPMEQKEIMDSFQVREALETKAAELAISNGTPSDFSRLAERAEAYDSFRHYQYDKKMMLNAEFHLQIASVSRNQVLKYLLRQNLEHMILRFHLDSFPVERMEVSSQEHSLLLDALKEKDLQGAAAVIRDHLAKSRSQVLAGISRNELESRESLAFFEDQE